MLRKFKGLFRRVFRIPANPVEAFSSFFYQRHNARRLEHLTSLGLNIAGRSVIEIGAGVGDHTSYFVDRGCQVMSTEPRLNSLEVLRSRYPNIKTAQVDIDTTDVEFDKTSDIVYCYGVLYHLKSPQEAIKHLSKFCSGMLLLETRVMFGEGDEIIFYNEDPKNPQHAVSGTCNLPTRKWIVNQLKEHFEYVYIPVTQPNHEEFPKNWKQNVSKEVISRAIFVASRQKLDNPLLTEELIMQQKNAQ